MRLLRLLIEMSPTSSSCEPNYIRKSSWPTNIRQVGHVLFRQGLFCYQTLFAIFKSHNKGTFRKTIALFSKCLRGSAPSEHFLIRALSHQPDAVRGNSSDMLNRAQLKYISPFPFWFSFNFHHQILVFRRANIHTITIPCYYHMLPNHCNIQSSSWWQVKNVCWMLTQFAHLPHSSISTDITLG